MGLKDVIQKIANEHYYEAIQIGDSMKINALVYGKDYKDTTECALYKMEISLHLFIYEFLKYFVK